jgi:hypothetical protein
MEVLDGPPASAAVVRRQIEATTCRVIWSAWVGKSIPNCFAIAA